MTGEALIVMEGIDAEERAEGDEEEDEEDYDEDEAEEKVRRHKDKQEARRNRRKEKKGRDPVEENEGGEGENSDGERPSLVDEEEERYDKGDKTPTDSDDEDAGEPMTREQMKQAWAEMEEENQRKKDKKAK